MASYTAQQVEATLKPTFLKYLHAVDNEIWDQVEAFYHPNGVLVHKDTEATYGNKAITDALRKFAAGTGKAQGKTSNEKYEGAGDYLILTADFASETEKMGTVKGKFLQIWKKDGEKWLIYHDEFEIVA